MTKINPIFACFQFNNIDEVRAAWKMCEDSPNVRNVSVWSSFPGTPILVILGEQEERVDAAAAIVMNAPGCIGNYILPEMLKRFFINRRYGVLGSEIRRRVEAGETIEDIQRAGGVRQRRSDQPL